MREVKRGQVYLAVLTGKGCEQRGKRPVLIIQNNVGNHFSPTTLIAPITSFKKKRNLPVHVPVESNKLFKDSVILCEQIQVMDKSRLIPIKKSCTGCNQRRKVIPKYTQIGYFTLNLDDAKEYLYAKSTKRRILSWRDIHVNVFI